MFKFLKKNKLPALIASLCTLLLAGAVVATVAWYEVNMQILPDVDSGIIMSYFESGDGSQGDPYVITRPIHYYNMVRLTEVGYEGFDNNHNHFQFGADLDSSGNPKFYNYNDSGIQQSGYSTSLNMNYYSGSKAISPLGSANMPFTGEINGNGLTVSNLHITGEGRADVGIFGYIATGGRVNDLYFDNVDIDLHKVNVSEINDASHTSHSTFSTFGYIAGHIHDNNTFDDVYVNNTSVRNSDSAGLPSAVKNNFGYIGYCDTVELPNVGDHAYRHTLHPEDVYQYLNSSYPSISGSSLVTRNTEYSTSGSFGDSITNPSSGRYSFTYQNGKAMSLATAGYQHQEQTYIAQYKNGGNYNMLTGASVTQTAPENQTTVGSYVYYDSTNSKWTYYTAQSEGGSPTTETFNVYYLSYHGITAGTSGTTYYLKYDNGNLGYTTTAPTSYASTPDYYFAFLTSPGTAGVTRVEDGTSNSYYIYSPHNDKYLYCPSGQNPSSNRLTLPFGDSETIAGATCEQAMFSISGSTSTEVTIDYGGTPCKIVGYNYEGGYNDPKYSVTNGQKPPLVFTLNGDPNTSGESDPIVSYTFVKTASSYAPAANDIITFVNELASKALGSTQNNNNRSAAAITLSNSSFVPGSNVARLKLIAGTGSYAGKFALQDVTPDAPTENYYLKSGTGSSNQLQSNSTLGSGSEYYFAITYNSATTARTRGDVEYNSSASIFACYSSGQQPINVYKLQSSSVTIHHEGAYEVEEQGETTEIITTTSYDIYYYDESVGTSSRAQLTSTFVNGWSLSGSTTYVTIAPEIISGWNLVEDQMDLIVGEKYVIAASTYNYTAGSINLGSGYLAGMSSTFNAGRTAITSLGANTYQFTLNGNTTDGYTFSCGDGQLYANNDTVNFAENGIGRWDITISSGVATIQVHGNTTYKLMYNNSGTRFKTYSSSQSAVRLYRLDSTEPQYIGDKIGNGYNPNYIDVVGAADFYSSYVRINSSTTRAIVEANDLNQRFYNTKYTKNSIVIRIPNRGSLDYGTVTIACGSNLPVFVKSGSNTVSLASVDCDEVDAQNRHLLYLNKYNIYQLSYCTLNSSGQINGCYDTDGDEVFQSGDIAEFVLVLGAPTSTNVDISYLDITFSTITGNLGDFGKVGFRSAPGTVPGEIFSFTYDLASSGYVYSNVTYDSATNTYNLSFKSSVALTLYVYNYDANRAIVKVNNTRYYGPYNAISIAASASPGSGGWTS